MTLTCGSLFSGIGGFDLAFTRAGFKTLWMVEIESNCQRILRKQFEGVDLYNDIKGCGKHNLAPVDIITGGFPCTDVSVAGRRAGLAGKQSGLWFEFHRVIEELKPKWVVIENVPGLLSSNGGKDFAVILRGLVKCGYGVSWRILDSQYFGVPQRRRRVYIVGSLGDGRSAKVLFERESSTRNTAPSRETGQDTSSSTLRGSDKDQQGKHCVVDALQARDYKGVGNQYVNENKLITGSVSSKWAKQSGGPAGDEAYNLVAFQQNHRDEVRLMGGDGEIVGALGSQPGAKQQNYIAYTLSQQDDDRNDGKGSLSVSEVEQSNSLATKGKTLIAFSSDRDGADAAENLSPTLQHGGDEPEHHQAFRKMAVAYTIQTNDGGEHKRKDRPNGGMYVEETDKALTVGSTDLTAIAVGHSGGETLKFNELANSVNTQTGSETTAMFQGVWQMNHASEAYRESADPSTTPTLQERMGTGGNNVPLFGVRRLTPKECARLQSFPDDWLDGLSDSGQYRVLGNAVTVNLAYWIANKIKELQNG